MIEVGNVILAKLFYYLVRRFRIFLIGISISFALCRQVEMGWKRVPMHFQPVSFGRRKSTNESTFQASKTMNGLFQSVTEMLQVEILFIDENHFHR